MDTHRPDVSLSEIGKTAQQLWKDGVGNEPEKVAALRASLGDESEWKREKNGSPIGRLIYEGPPPKRQAGELDPAGEVIKLLGKAAHGSVQLYAPPDETKEESLIRARAEEVDLGRAFLSLVMRPRFTFPDDPAATVRLIVDEHKRLSDAANGSWTKGLSKYDPDEEDAVLPATYGKANGIAIRHDDFEPDPDPVVMALALRLHWEHGITVEQFREMLAVWHEIAAVGGEEEAVAALRQLDPPVPDEVIEEMAEALAPEPGVPTDPEFQEQDVRDFVAAPENQGKTYRQMSAELRAMGYTQFTSPATLWRYRRDAAEQY